MVISRFRYRSREAAPGACSPRAGPCTAGRTHWTALGHQRIRPVPGWSAFVDGCDSRAAAFLDYGTTRHFIRRPFRADGETRTHARLPGHGDRLRASRLEEVRENIFYPSSVVAMPLPLLFSGVAMDRVAGQSLVGIGSWCWFLAHGHTAQNDVDGSNFVFWLGRRRSRCLDYFPNAGGSEFIHRDDDRMRTSLAEAHHEMSIAV